MRLNDDVTEQVAIKCLPNHFDLDGVAANGCEVSCASVPNGTCTSCSTTAAAGCQAVACLAGAVDRDADPSNGCEATDHSVLGCGSNNFGQLGVGTAGPSYNLTQIAALKSDVRSFAYCRWPYYSNYGPCCLLAC